MLVTCPHPGGGDDLFRYSFPKIDGSQDAKYSNPNFREQPGKQPGKQPLHKLEGSNLRFLRTSFKILPEAHRVIWQHQPEHRQGTRSSSRMPSTLEPYRPQGLKPGALRTFSRACSNWEKPSSEAVHIVGEAWAQLCLLARL